MVGRAILLLGRRGWAYLVLTAVVLAPLYVVRVRSGVRLIDRMDMEFMQVIVQMALVTVPMSFVPYLVMRALTGAPLDPRGWFKQVGLSIVGMCVLSVVSLPVAFTVGLVAVLVTTSVGFALLAALGALVFLLHRFGHHLINAQSRVIQDAGFSGFARSDAAQRRYKWIARVLSIGFIGTYLVLPHMALDYAPLVRIVREAGWEVIVGAQALCLVLWSVLTTVAWHETYGPVDTMTERELAETFA